MAQGRTFDDGQRARGLFDQGKSCNAIAKELGVSPSTISLWAKREGLSFDRAKTQDAVAAAKVDRASRRGAIINRLYARSEALLTRLEAPTFRTLVPIGEGAMASEDLDYVPTIDEKNLAASINMYLDRAVRLEALDDVEGLAPVESMLGRLAERFGLVSSGE